jgi:hypothetical protein
MWNIHEPVHDEQVTLLIGKSLPSRTSEHLCLHDPDFVESFSFSSREYHCYSQLTGKHVDIGLRAQRDAI